jgi:vancomycin resistance protein VanJ
MLLMLRRCRAAWKRFWPPRSGPITLLFAVFRPYILPPVILLLSLARWRYARAFRALLLGMVMLTLQRRIRRRQATIPSGPPRFSVMSWNILFENPCMDEMLRFLATAPAEIVALQELTADHVQQITNNFALARCYPHQILWTCGYGAGMGLLSQYPIVDQGKIDKPPTLWARINLQAGREIVLVSAHPTFFPPRQEREVSQPAPSLFRRITHLLDRRFLRYSTLHRDDGIMRVRHLVDQFLRLDTPILVVGDFNVTEREQAYRELSAGLVDVHRIAGTGNGHTWRPEWLARWPLTILRIDYMFSSRGLRPFRMAVDRTPRGSDHSLIRGEFDFE